MSLKPSSELLSFRRSVRQPAADPLSWAFPKLPEWSEFVEDAGDDIIDLAGETVHGLLSAVNKDDAVRACRKEDRSMDFSFQ